MSSQLRVLTCMPSYAASEVPALLRVAVLLSLLPHGLYAVLRASAAMNGLLSGSGSLHMRVQVFSS